MRLLSQEELDTLLPAETSAFPSPIPTQIVSVQATPPASQETTPTHDSAYPQKSRMNRK